MGESLTLGLIGLALSAIVLLAYFRERVSQWWRRKRGGLRTTGLLCVRRRSSFSAPLRSSNSTAIAWRRSCPYRKERTSCGGQTYSGGSGTGLRPGSSLSFMCLVAGSNSRSTTRQEAGTGMISGSCWVLALLFWAHLEGELEGVNNPRDGQRPSNPATLCPTRHRTA